MRNRISWLPCLLLGGATVLAGACAPEAEDLYDEDVAAVETVETTATTGYGTTDLAAAGTGWGTYEDWDVDTDEAITDAEFGERYADVGYYDGWDTNTDTFVDADEYGAGFFSQWDTDASGDLDEGEWAAVGTLYGEDDLGTFAEADTDTDQRVTTEELQARLSGSDLFVQWDTDGDDRLSPDELRGQIWQLLDKDGDSQISRSEFEQGVQQLS